MENGLYRIVCDCGAGLAFACLQTAADAFTPDAGLLTSREIWSTIKWNFRLDLRLERDWLMNKKEANEIKKIVYTGRLRHHPYLRLLCGRGEK